MYLPVGQTMQLDAVVDPTSVPNFPAGHVKQDVNPLTGKYVPALHVGAGIASENTNCSQPPLAAPTAAKGEVVAGFADTHWLFLSD